MEQRLMDSQARMLNAKGLLARYWWIPVYYLAALGVLFFGSRYMIEINGSVVILAVVAVLPLVLPYLQSIEAFGVKVAIRKLKSEVVETRQVVRQELSTVRALSERFEMLLQKSEDFLKPKPLDEAFRHIAEIRRALSEKELSEEEIANSLHSHDPNCRVLAYIELQLRPRRDRLQDLMDCLYLEHHLARKRKETRPLWQLLETAHRFSEQITNLTQEERDYARFSISQTLELLKRNAHLDTGGQCKTSAQNSLRRSSSMNKTWR